MPTLTTIEITPIKPAQVIGGTIQFIAVGYDENGVVMDFDKAWTSSNTAVGTIDCSTGIFTAIAAGVTTITLNSEGL